MKKYKKFIVAVLLFGLFVQKSYAGKHGDEEKKVSLASQELSKLEFVKHYFPCDEQYIANNKALQLFLRKVNEDKINSQLILMNRSNNLSRGSKVDYSNRIKNEIAILLKFEKFIDSVELFCNIDQKDRLKIKNFLFNVCCSDPINNPKQDIKKTLTMDPKKVFNVYRISLLPSHQQIEEYLGMNRYCVPKKEMEFWNSLKKSLQLTTYDERFEKFIELINNKSLSNKDIDILYITFNSKKSASGRWGVLGNYDCFVGFFIRNIPLYIENKFVKTPFYQDKDKMGRKAQNSFLDCQFNFYKK